MQIKDREIETSYQAKGTPLSHSFKSSASAQVWVRVMRYTAGFTHGRQSGDKWRKPKEDDSEWLCVCKGPGDHTGSERRASIGTLLLSQGFWKEHHSAAFCIQQAAFCDAFSPFWWLDQTTLYGIVQHGATNFSLDSLLTHSSVYGLIFLSLWNLSTGLPFWEHGRSRCAPANA